MLHFPNAKINLGLYITQKRPDGYHDLETIFYPLPQLKDALEVTPAADGETSIRFSGKPVPGHTEDNLVAKALRLLQERYPDRIPPLRVQLHKVIPMGAGLGGGSADGAFMLRLLNKFCELNISDTTLAELALELGSDCPFFIYNTPQLAKGRGELMSPVDINLSEYSIQVLCPGIHVPTAAAFKDIRPAAASFDLRQLGKLPVQDWKQVLKNDFEETVFGNYPELSAIKQQLYDAGALYASMTGTGSAVYGIFPKGKQAVPDKELEAFYCE